MTIGGLKKNSSPLALVAAAGFLMGGLALTPAMAADLGGDCCADLEERVAELEATTARKGNRKVSLTISGFINRSFGWYEDAHGDSEFYAAGRGGSYGSRVQFAGSAALTSRWTAGYTFRFRTIGDVGIPGAAGGNNGNRAGAGSNQGGNSVGRDLNFVYLKNARLGTFVTGHVYAPSKQIEAISLGGHNVIGAEGNAWNGSALNGFELEQNGAHQAIAWISPTIRGFTYSVAWLDLNNTVAAGTSTSSATDAFDMALRYAQEFGPIRVAAGIAYTFVDSDANVGVEDGSNVSGSFSLIHTPTGLNAAFAAGTENEGGFLGGRDGSGTVAGTAVSAASDAYFWRIEGGLNKDFTGHGNTSIYGEYAEYNYDLAAGVGGIDEVSLWGIGVVQHFDKAATELYLAYRQWNGETVTGADFGDGDVNQVLVGMRIKF